MQALLQATVNTHAHSPPPTHPPSHPPTHPPTHPLTHSPTHPPTHSFTLTHTHTRTYARTHARTNAHTTYTFVSSNILLTSPVHTVHKPDTETTYSSAYNGCMNPTRRVLHCTWNSCSVCRKDVRFNQEAVVERVGLVQVWNWVRRINCQ